MHMTTLVTGAVIFTLMHSLFWTIIATLIGNLIGAIFVALHSAQGPQLGIPQMIQSRAQFGVIGAIVPLIVALFIYMGYLLSSGLLGAQAISNVLSIHLTPAIIIMDGITFLVVLFGYDMIQKFEKYFSWIVFVVFSIVTIIALSLVGAGGWSLSGFDPVIFMLGVSMNASWQLSFAPYVADYSRYLPINTSSSKTFWYTYGGTVLGSAWMEIIGAMLAFSIPNFLDHPSSNLAQMVFNGSFIIPMLIVIFLGQLAINVFNMYGAFMSTTTVLEPFAKLKMTPMVRGLFIAAVTFVGVVLTIWGQNSFMAIFSNFISFLGYCLIPWTSINLIDYYLLRRGKYSVKDIFDVKGIYGKVNWIAISAYAASILLQIPFMSTSFYTGPIVKMLGGADIAWAVGLVIPFVLYYFPMKGKINKHNEKTIIQKREELNS